MKLFSIPKYTPTDKWLLSAFRRRVLSGILDTAARLGFLGAVVASLGTAVIILRDKATAGLMTPRHTMELAVGLAWLSGVCYLVSRGLR